MMRAGRLGLASAIAVRVGKLIDRANKNHLNRLSSKTDTGELWRCVGEVTGKQKRSVVTHAMTAEDLNTH